MNVKSHLISLPKDFLRFRGVATRSEYIIKMIAIFVANIVLGTAWLYALRTAEMDFGAPMGLIFLLVISTPVLLGVPTLLYAVPLTCRRFNDTGITGWLYIGVLAVSAALVATMVLSWVAGLINLAVILYCALVPTGQAPSVLVEAAPAKQDPSSASIEPESLA